VRTTLLTLAGIILGTVGASRVYFGQHWPSDVLAGHLLGGLWLVLAIGVYRLMGRRRASRG
jgi:membrane-associated phospholipid phosphatase